MGFLPAAKLGILENARDFDEILLVDDGSQDGSFGFCHSWAKEDSRVHLIRNPNPGLVSALNTGVRTSSNSLIARFDVDDIYSASRLEKQLTQFGNEDVAIFSDYRTFDIRGNFLGKFPSAIFPHAVSISLIKSRRTPHPSVIFRRETALEVGGYRAEDYLAEDLSMWLRLSRYGNLASVPEVLLDYRLSPGGITSSSRTQMNSKRREILKSIGINTPDIRKSIDELEQTLNRYQSFENTEERKLLHLSELLVCIRDQNLKTNKERNSIKVAARLCRPHYLKSSANLAFEKYQRNKARKND